MASFFRRLFRRSSPAQAPAPAPKPAAPAAKPVGSVAGPEDTPSKGRATQGRAGKKSRTQYTSTLGLSQEARSGINLKTLTGM